MNLPPLALDNYNTEDSTYFIYHPLRVDSKLNMTVRVFYSRKKEPF